MSNYSYIIYTADGNTDTFVVPFRYILPEHVKVYINDILYSSGEDTSKITWTTPGTIKLASIPQAGALVKIKRETKITERLVNYQDTSVLDETVLDTDSNQLFNLVQEAYDTANYNMDALNEAVESTARYALSASQQAQIAQTNATVTTQKADITVQYADADEDVEIAPNVYSAKHWYQKTRKKWEEAWVSVTDFGGDIQAAIDSLTNGGTVRIPKGTYNFTYIQISKSNITLEGDGFETILIPSDIQNGIFIYSGNDAVGIEGIKIRNLCLKGTYANRYSRGIFLRGVHKSIFEKLKIENFGYSAFASYKEVPCTYNTFKNNYMYNCGDFGIGLTNAPWSLIDGNIVDGCVGQNYPPHGIYLKYDCSNSKIVNNTVLHITGTGATGIEISGGDDWSTTGINNIIVSCNTVVDSDGGITSAGGNMISIIGNTIKDILNTKYAIHLYQANTSITIANNTIDSTSTGIFVNGIDTNNYAKKVSITGNTIKCVGNASVLVTYADGVTVTGNTLDSGYSAAYTCFANNSKDVNISNNVLISGDRALNAVNNNRLTFNNNTVKDGGYPNSGYAVRITTDNTDVIAVGNNLRGAVGALSIVPTDAVVGYNLPPPTG